MRVIEDWPTYVRRVAAGLTQAQIAARVGGVSTSYVGRWLRGEPGQPGAELVIGFARAFDQPVGEALAIAGYLDDADVATQSRTPLSEYSTDELFGELRQRTIDGR